MNQPLVPLILAGGAGTRLWPASRQALPKPFLTMPDGETLFEKTWRRAEQLAAGGPILVVANRSYAELIKTEIERCAADPGQQRLLLEPAARNTAPAIAVAMAWVAQHLPADACVLVMPSDHLIHQEEKFTAACRDAGLLAADQWLVTFGITPGYPETGYGYIQAGAALAQGNEVARFVEKPDLARARSYVASGDYVWNSGMFGFTAAGFDTALRAADKTLADAAAACLAASNGGGEHLLIDAASFAQLTATSIDYALLEKAARVAVVAGDFGWDDVGSWEAIAKLDDGAGANQVLVDCRDVYIRSGGRLVAAVGVKNLVIIDTPDALLVCDRAATQDVKTVVDQLKADSAKRSLV